LIHRFRGVEIYASYGNTNLGASNDQGEERAYLLAGTGDDKTDIVVYAEVYNRAAIYSRDRDISSNADFTRFGGSDNRSPDFAGRVGASFTSRSVTAAGHHAAFTTDVANDPRPCALSLPQAQQGNYAALTPAMPLWIPEYPRLAHPRSCNLTVFADSSSARFLGQRPGARPLRKYSLMPI
jgi:hypothetical protein